MSAERGEKFTDWDPTTLQIHDEGDAADPIEVVPNPPPIELPDGGAVNEAVEYGEGYAAAFFDANDRPIRRELASYAKVWDTVDSEPRLRIIALDGGAGAIIGEPPATPPAPPAVPSSRFADWTADTIEVLEG